jgi:sterol desaturase/sphingolipid hydroxylase (fatty acid hydroxylase superfamily)
MMDSRALFEPSVHAYLAYCAEFCIRYFALAGGLYWVLHVGFKQRWLAYRIQQTFPGLDAIRHEIAWSMANTACTGLSTLLVYRFVHDGRTHMYFGVADYGWAYLALSAVLCIVGYDTWIYWQHRWMHTPWMFNHVHWVHHRVGNPTPFATFAQHPIETFAGNVYFVLFVVFVPVHPIAIAGAGAYMFLAGIVGHLGYEFYPRWFSGHSLCGWLITSTYHNIHHRSVRCNYGAWFICWDRLMGTDHPGYQDAFAAVAARRSGRGTAHFEDDERRLHTA